MFHTQDGLYFERLDDSGKVRVVKRVNAHPDAPVVFEQVLDAFCWMSVITEVGCDPGRAMPLANEIHRGIGSGV